MSETAQLVCWTTSGDDSPHSVDNTSNQRLDQETGKKSSFLLHLEDAVLEKPMHTQVIVENNSQNNFFFLGGFQIISNAKQSDVYLTDNDGNEKILTTSRGIPFEKGNGEKWFKAVCVIPGGPRSVTRLRLRLSSLQPADTTILRVKYLKLTARIPEKAAVPQKAAPPREQLGAMPLPALKDAGSPLGGAQPSALSFMFHPHQQSPFAETSRTNLNFGGVPSKHPHLNAASPPTSTSNPHSNLQNSPSSQRLTQDDLGAAMAGISMMARSTQKEMEESLNQHVSKLQQSVDARWIKMEGYISSLTSVVVSQKTVLDEKCKILMQQHETISEQSRQISALVKTQQEMVSTLIALQSDVSGLRQHITDTSQQSDQKQQQTQQEIVSVVKSIQTLQQDDFSGAIKSLEFDVSDLCQLTRENASKSNSQPDELFSTVESLQTEVIALRERIEETSNRGNDTQREQEIVATLNTLQSEVSTFREGMQDFLKGENDQQMELSTTLQSLQLDVSDLRQRIQTVPMESQSNPQQPDLNAAIESLRWDLSELQRSVKENADETRCIMRQVSPQHQAEIVLNGSKDFPDDVLEVRSLGATDTPNTVEETPSSDGVRNVQVDQENGEPKQSTNETDRSEIATGRGLTQLLENAGPPPFDPSATNGSEESTKDNEMKSTGSDESCPGLETIEVSLMIDDDASSEMPVQEDEESLQHKKNRKVMFKDIGLEDRFEYDRPSSISMSEDSSDKRLSKTPKGSKLSSAKEEEGSDEDNNVFERGLQLFNYYSSM
eukprot:scaffold22600_cov195-Cylindrotheca_fusiformis.AAC.2